MLLNKQDYELMLKEMQTQRMDSLRGLFMIESGIIGLKAKIKEFK